MLVYGISCFLSVVKCYLRLVDSFVVHDVLTSVGGQ